MYVYFSIIIVIVIVIFVIIIKYVETLKRTASDSPSRSSRSSTKTTRSTASVQVPLQPAAASSSYEQPAAAVSRQKHDLSTIGIFMIAISPRRLLLGALVLRVYF